MYNGIVKTERGHLNMINGELMQHLSELTDEEKEILSGRNVIDRGRYMTGDNQTVSGIKLLETGKLMTIRPHTRFIRFPKHTHDYVEMVYMCSGVTEHHVGDTTVILKEGDLLILAQNAEQEIEPAGADDIAVNFIIRPDFFSGVLKYLGEQDTPLKHFLIDCMCGRSDMQYLLFQVSGIIPIQNLIENLLFSQYSQIGNKRETQTITMGLLFMQLINHSEALQAGTGEQNAVVTVLRYIEDRYSDGTLTEIAQDLHYNIHFLSRLIKQKTGKTFTELIQDKRLSQAAWLLHNTGRNIDEIAIAVGYENISYFHRLFQSHYGQSPRQYRICK